MPFGLEDIYQSILSQIKGVETHSVDFLFSPDKSPYLDIASIYASLEKEWETIKPTLEDKDRKQDLADIIFPKKPYDLKVIKRLHDIFLSPSLTHPPIFLDICIMKILTEILGKRKMRVSPQLLLELLNLCKLGTPEFLTIIKPILQIIVDQNKIFSHVIKTHACEVLINNYESEALFIFISCAMDLKEEEKQVLFQSLTAFQKIYRKFLELHVGVHEKDLISMRWFGVTYNQLRRKGEWRDSFSNLIRRFIEYLKKRDKGEAIQVGRFLVLRFNNEDILRVIHHEISRDPDLSFERPLAWFIYRQVYRIMQEFRKNYISQKVDTELTQAISKTEAQAIDAMRMITVGKVPAFVVLKGLGKGPRPAKAYTIFPEFMEKLDLFNLKALFELYPIPPISQQIFNLIANIADSMELGRDEFFLFIAYMEKLLIFLQELEEMDIKAEKDSAYGLIKNTYQFNSLNLIKQGAYFASTGLWYQNTIPPSIIRCISPNAIPNCVGVRDRHIFSRISMLTGSFRGSPFDLDSTNRYNWDEEPETCLFRPGYSQIAIPQSVRQRWEETQNLQRDMLNKLIQDKQWN
jgi:predicted CopG family antitoxin